MLIKKAPPLSDPNRDSNIKHCTADELRSDKNKRKEKRYKIPCRKAFMRYEEGQYEQIFKKANN